METPKPNGRNRYRVAAMLGRKELAAVVIHADTDSEARGYVKIHYRKVLLLLLGAKHRGTKWTDLQWKATLLDDQYTLVI